MATNNTRRKAFAQTLCLLYPYFDNDDFNVSEFNEKAMSAFLRFGAGALYHERYSEIIEFGKAIGNDPDEEIHGFKVKGKDVFLASILNRLESIAIPPEVLERFPDLTEEEWLASIRVVTCVLDAFSPIKPIKSSE